MQQSSGSQPQSSATLDVRGMKAPDNILSVLKKAGELENGSTLEFLIESNPFQLYDLLQQRGCMLEMRPQKDGTFLGRVTSRNIEAQEH
jgi:TusA-related sulfurtransferase